MNGNHLQLQTSMLKGIEEHKHAVIYDYENGEKICSSCGLVLMDKINDAELETDYYKYKSDTNSSLPYSLTLYDQGISTTICDTVKSKSKNKMVDLKEQNKIGFLNKIVSYSNEKRNLKIAIDIVNRVKDKLHLTSACIEDAFYYYKKALDAGLIKGRSIKEMVIACVYISCKKANIPRTLGEIAQIVNGNKIFASRCYRILTREFKVSYTQFDPVMFIQKIANEAKISERTTRKAIDLLLAIKSHESFMGKDPLSIAAAILYAACREYKEKISQAKIASAANINIITLRKRFSDIKDVMYNVAFLN
ncbi:MAG: transcription initiation factor IIB family protein [Thermoproteota archaeon]|nr:transcription initiation factor IIB family protein [Thermoproteota archaeon]